MTFAFARKWALRSVVAVLALMPLSLSTLAQQDDIAAIQRRFREFEARGNYAAAEVEARKLEQAVKSRFGTDHVNYTVPLDNFAKLYQDQGKYGEAEVFDRRALGILEKALGANDPKVADALNNVAEDCRLQGRYGEAEALNRRALAIQERVLGANHPRLASPLHNLALVDWELGRYGEAEALNKRALSIREKTLGVSHIDVAASLDNLAHIYMKQDKLSDAEALYRRSLAIKEKALGAANPAVATSLSNLAGACMVQAKYSEAEGLLKRAVAIEEQLLGASHPHLAVSLGSLATVYRGQAKYGEAEALYRRALMIQERMLGTDHPGVAVTLGNLAGVCTEQAKYGEAQGFLDRALSIKEKALGPNHPSTALALQSLAISYAKSNDVGHALNYFRRASAAVIAHAAGESSKQQSANSDGLIAQRVDYFQRHVAALVAASYKGIEPAAAAAREAFEISQWASQSSAAAALQQTGARFEAGGGTLAALIRENQDLAAAWNDKDKLLTAALSKPETQQDRSATEALRKQILDLENQRATNVARLEKQFPEYAALTSPKPLKVEDVQAFLRPDEALAFFLVGEKASYAFAVTRDSFDAELISLGAADVSAKVAALRRGLDVEKAVNANDGPGKAGLFDLGLANELYVSLLGPIEALVKDKGSLLIASSGVLTALPFHLLVTDRPAAALPETFDGYRDAAWLIKRQAVSVLPSVASLKALRAIAHKDPNTRPMIGFGDPVFDFGKGRPGETRAATKARSLVAGSYTDFWQGAGVDRDKLAKSLPRLPDTADELNAVALRLGAPSNDIHLGGDASETTVKRAKLTDYGIVYFATHGLVAGDVKGVAEPSLVLSLPQQPTDFDDGLLTASEVAQLKLNADWVVLSACNTIAGNKPGAEALSGLARSFFYAGARALLVSHWAVDSEAATRLTISTFDRLKADTRIGRAEALRQAMLSYLGDTSSPKNADPAFWGPFALIGEGANR